MFESALSEPWPFYSSHALVQVETKIGGKTWKILMRGEIDCCAPNGSDFIFSVDNLK
jgi:hypothetical protein